MLVSMPYRVTTTKLLHPEINIYMEGGDLATFNETMADNFPIECKLDDWAKCQDMVKSIIRYSSSTFPADIAKGHTRNIHKTVTKYDMTEDKVDPVFAERRDVLSKETERQAILLAKIEDILKLESDKLTKSQR